VVFLYQFVFVLLQDFIGKLAELRNLEPIQFIGRIARVWDFIIGTKLRQGKADIASQDNQFDGFIAGNFVDDLLDHTFDLILHDRAFLG